MRDKVSPLRTTYSHPLEEEGGGPIGGLTGGLIGGVLGRVGGLIGGVLGRSGPGLQLADGIRNTIPTRILLAFGPMVRRLMEYNFLQEIL